METAGIKDHVTPPDMAISQIKHTAAAVINNAEKMKTRNFFDFTRFSPFPFITSKCSSFFSSSGSLSSLSPFNSSFTVIPNMSHSSSMIEESGRLFPVSHFEIALSVIFSSSASWAWVSFFALRHLEINAPTSI
jgi:hypothetical protein